MTARSRLLPLVIGTALLAGCAAGKDAVDQGNQFTFVSPGGQSKIFYSESQRKALPDMSGDSLAKPGSTIRLSDFPGKIVVLNIWGQWCGPCRSEAPELEQVYNQTRASGVQLLGIDVRDQRSAAQDFVQNNQISYPSIFDDSGRTLLALRNYPRSVVPSTIVLDRQHRVAAIYLQRVFAGELLPELRQLAGQH